KGTSFDNLTQFDVNLMMSHINSTPRESLGGLTPLKLAKMMLPDELLKMFNQREIKPDEVMLTSKLLEDKFSYRKNK
ncbi:MAG: IS30 family transposase, partial [Eubacterium sp.]|nr:IS30 family transposase [Eubacterium sp.]